jgi:hypothetical protein
MLMDVFFLGPEVPHRAETAAHMTALVKVQPVVEKVAQEVDNQSLGPTPDLQRSNSRH